MLFESVFDDLRIGFRTVVKEKTFCALAVGVLAIGICSVTTQFSVINGVVLRGFSFPDSHRIASVEIIDPSQTTAFGDGGQITTADFLDFVGTQQSFQMMAGYLNGSTVNVTINGDPQRFTGAYVTEDFFKILQVSPIRGRSFTAADNIVGAPKVALISYQVWTRDFGGDLDIVNRTVRINGRSATIIGVMPPGFAFPINEQLWLPLFTEFPPQPRGTRNVAGNEIAVLGRLQAGTSLAQANAEFTTIAQRFAQAYPSTNASFNAAKVQELIRAFTAPQVRGMLWTMLGFCGLLLAMACANVMNMQFARATLRAKELAIRSSLGATRIRLIRQMLTENILLASLGTVIGVLASYWIVDALDAAIRNQPVPPPSYIRFDIDNRVLAFTVAITLLAGVLSGIVPAILSSRANASDVLKESGRGNTSALVTTITRGLVTLQVLFASVLLVGALLQAQSIVRQQHVRYGYDTEVLLSGRMGLMEGDYPTPNARREFYEKLLRELRSRSQFESVALTNRMRMVFSGDATVEIEGLVYKSDRDRSNANFEQVSEGYFTVTQQRLLEGRDFAENDDDNREPLAVVNASFARKHFGTESPLSRRFRTTTNNNTLLGPWRRIIGVVSDVRMLGPFNNPKLDMAGFYIPFLATPFGPVPPELGVSQFATILVRPRGATKGEAAISALRREVTRVDPNLPLYFVGTPQSHHDAFVGQNRIIAVMFTLFGVIAVIMSSVGLYGVMSFAVNQRTQEFGIRMALGAERPRVLWMVLRQGAWQLGMGLAAGLGITVLVAVLANEALQTVLFQISPLDPLTYIAVALLLASVSFVATVIPALRATRVDPIIALRAE